MGTGLIVDVTGKEPGHKILLSDVEPYRDKIESAQIVLCRTDWYKTTGTKKFLNHPYLSKDVRTFLQKKGINTVGIDAINIDSTGGDQFPIHDMYAALGGVIAENLANFDHIGFDNPFIIILPLKLIGCDGSPVRAVAVEFDI